MILRDLNEITVQNPEPYNSIYGFINTKIIPKYPCLTHCYQDNFDEEGNLRIQYYIRYAANLSLKEEDKLYLDIMRDIWNFCASCGISCDEELNADFILAVDGDFVEKHS
jgi:hypothetical protein